MMRLACGGTLRLTNFGECQGSFTTMTLRKAGELDISLSAVELPPPQEGVFELTPASQPARGVWRLFITTFCGCYDAPVFVEACNAPAFASTHNTTEPMGVTEVCCGPQP